MKKGIRSTAIRTRDKIFGKLSDQISDLNSKLEVVDKTLHGSKEALLEVSDKTLSTINKNYNMSLNSGFVRISDTEIVTKIFSGLKMYVDPRDISFTPHITLDHIWESNITAAWLALVKSDSTVLDIGANFGYYGALAAQYADKKKANIILFEANPELIPYIDKTLSLNWLREQTTIANFAVSNKNGKAQLNVLKDYIGSSSLHTSSELDSYMHKKMNVETAKLITVPSTTIDSYCEKNKITTVDLIKMDIEGYEDKAYQGMRKTIKASPNATMFIEFTKDAYEDPKKFYSQLIEDFGNVYIIYGGRIIKAKKKDYESIVGSFDDWVMPIFSKRGDLEQMIEEL